MFKLTTPRLTLRDLKIEDLEDLAKLCLDPEITRYMEYIKRKSIGEVEEWLREMIKYNDEVPRKTYNFAIIENETNRMIGWIGIGEPTKEGKGDMDFGYAIYKDSQGKGYGREALKSLLDFSLSLPDIYEITGECDAQNVASEKVMLAVGMKLVKVTEEDNEISKHFSIFSSKRPYVVCHMMASIDGKITFGRINGKEVAQQVFDDYFDLYVEAELSYQSKAMLFGRITMEMFSSTQDISLPQAAGSFKVEDYLPRPILNYALGIDTKGKLRWKGKTIRLNDKDYDLIIIVTKQSPLNYLQYLRENEISYIVAGEGNIDFKVLFAKLKELGIERLIIEGGGITNGAILAEEFIDEISLLQIPLVINNLDTVSVFEHKMKECAVHEFKLHDVVQLKKDVVWLRYLKKSESNK